MFEVNNEVDYSETFWEAKDSPLLSTICLIASRDTIKHILLCVMTMKLIVSKASIVAYLLAL